MKRLHAISFLPQKLGAFALVLASCVFAGSRPECSEDRDFYAYLSGTQGLKSASAEKPFLLVLPCDTMMVGNGILVNVLPNTKIVWEFPSASNMLVVSGSLRLGSNVDIGNGDNWLGIYLDSGASLLGDSLVITKTKTPLSLHPKSKLVLGFLGTPQGAEFTIQNKPPSKWLFPSPSLDTLYYPITHQDFENLGRAKKTFWAKWKKPAIVSGATLAVAGAAFWGYTWYDENPKPSEDDCFTCNPPPTPNKQ